jgi:hypothetical protein
LQESVSIIPCIATHIDTYDARLENIDLHTHHKSGGLEGPKPPTSGGIGSFKVGSNSKAAPKKETPKKQVVAKKTNNSKKAPVEEKKKTNLWIKTPWSK